MLRVVQVTPLVALLAVTAPTAADTLVVCEPALRDALVPWMTHRTQQGHAIRIVEADDSAMRVRHSILQAAEGGQIRFVLLVGDVISRGGAAGRQSHKSIGVPTNYARSVVNVRWGSEPYIATDLPYADFDEDMVPDIAIGRMPVDSREELASVVRKILKFEQHVAKGGRSQRMTVAAGVGGFGGTIDAVIEAVARQVLGELIPKTYEVDLTRATSTDGKSYASDHFPRLFRQQLGGESLAWIYMGHGRVHSLDMATTRVGPRPMLSVADLRAPLAVTTHDSRPLAVMMACHTGAFDKATDCLAEELLVDPDGPVAVLAATRVSMPYGNAVLGYELLRECFGDECDTLGELFVAAQRHALQDKADDPWRRSVDQLARGLMPPPANLTDERREHVEMYHLLGDPLLRLPVRADGRSKGRIARTDDGPDKVTSQ